MTATSAATTTSSRKSTEPLRDTRRNIPAAIALLGAVVTFFVAEAIAAAAWHHPTYSYAADFVSDLGVTGPAVMFKGHLIHSPRAVVMNAGFVVNGVLVALAAMVVLRRRVEDQLARWHRRLLVGYGVGLVTAAFFHEWPSWSFPLHALGATLSIGGGCVAVLLTGRLGDRLDLRTWLANTFTSLGVLGLFFFLVVQVVALVNPTLPSYIGALERLAAYPVAAAELIAGVGLLAESARLRAEILVRAR